MALEFRKLDNPTYCPSGYHLDLYCDHSNPDHAFDEFPASPTECETLGQARSKARRWGWVIHRDGTATCPKCARRLATKEPS